MYRFSGDPLCPIRKRDCSVQAPAQYLILLQVVPRGVAVSEGRRSQTSPTLEASSLDLISYNYFAGYRLNI